MTSYCSKHILFDMMKKTSFTFRISLIRIKHLLQCNSIRKTTIFAYFTEPFCKCLINRVPVTKKMNCQNGAVAVYLLYRTISFQIKKLIIMVLLYIEEFIYSLIDSLVWWIFIIGSVIVIARVRNGIKNKNRHLLLLYKTYISGYAGINICQVKKYFKEHPDLLDECEQRWKQKQQEEYENNENKRKQMFINRIFAYDYEELLFELYAPLANHRTGCWETGFGVGPTHEELLQKIMASKNVSKEKADDIIKELEHHGIIYQCKDGYGLGSVLNGISRESTIVSDSDMNLDKWMNAHGYEPKK